MPRAVFWLINIFNCLSYDWTDEWEYKLKKGYVTWPQTGYC
jgi:hypothetical protein